MKINTLIKINKWYGILIELNRPYGLFQSIITGEKICISLRGIREEDVIFTPLFN